MQIATKNQMRRLMQQGDDSLYIAATGAAMAINTLMDEWGDMPDWKIKIEAQQLRNLLEMIEAK